MSLCPCGSKKEYEVCCRPFIVEGKNAPTAEATMRARYSAFALGEIGYVEKTHHPETRDQFDVEETRRWSLESKWHGLDIVKVENGSESDTKGMVEFVAHYEFNNVKHDHHERSDFRKDKGIWYFYDGSIVQAGTIRREAPKVGRNDPCPCGSGKKFKKCCADKV